MAQQEGRIDSSISGNDFNPYFINVLFVAIYTTIV